MQLLKFLAVRHGHFLPHIARRKQSNTALTSALDPEMQQPQRVHIRIFIYFVLFVLTALWNRTLEEGIIRELRTEIPSAKQPVHPCSSHSLPCYSFSVWPSVFQRNLSAFVKIGLHFVTGALGTRLLPFGVRPFRHRRPFYNATLYYPLAHFFRPIPHLGAWSQARGQSDCNSGICPILSSLSPGTVRSPPPKKTNAQGLTRGGHGRSWNWLSKEFSFRFVSFCFAEYNNLSLDWKCGDMTVRDAPCRHLGF